ncbi:hypothetical protein MUP95_01330 [bacterium]|nr:hypothetical protein [bacterium]
MTPETYRFYFQWQESNAKPILSNEIEITIIDPSGDEAKALTLIEKATYNMNIHEPVDTFSDSLIEIFPQSVYVGLALDIKLLSHYFINEPTHIIQGMKAAKKILEYFPDSILRSTSLESIQKYYKLIDDFTGYKEYINAIRDKTKSEKLKKNTQIILDEINITNTWEKPPVVSKPSTEELPPPPPPPSD